MRLALPCLAACALAGCTTSPEVKRASTQMTQALAALDGAKEDFKKSLLAEIDATRAQVARAMVARAVRARIDQAAAGHESNGNLLALSDEIDGTAQSVARMVDLLKTVKVGPAPTAAEVDEALRGSVEARLKDLDRTIALFAASPDTAAALKRQRAILETWRAPGAIRDDLETLIRLAGLRAYVETRLLAEFETHVRVLRLVHATADAWIQTDATIDGAKVAGVVKEGQQLLDGWNK